MDEKELSSKQDLQQCSETRCLTFVLICSDQNTNRDTNTQHKIQIQIQIKRQKQIQNTKFATVQCLRLDRSPLCKDSGQRSADLHPCAEARKPKYTKFEIFLDILFQIFLNVPLLIVLSIPFYVFTFHQSNQNTRYPTT